MPNQPTNHSCGFCGKELKIPAHLAGKRIRCTNCSLVFTAPSSSDEGSSPEIVEPESAPKKKRERPKEHRGVKILILSVLSLLPALFVNLYTIFFGKPTVARNDADGAFLVTVFWLFMSLCVLFSIITIIITWLMANRDLKEMAKKRMDPDGYGLTKTGQIICLVVIVNLIIGGLLKIFVGEKVEKQNASAKVVEKESQEPASEVKVAPSPITKNENNNPPRAEVENDKIYQDKYSLITINYSSKKWERNTQAAVANEADMAFLSIKHGSFFIIYNSNAEIKNPSEWLSESLENLKRVNPAIIIKVAKIIKINNRDSLSINFFDPKKKLHFQMIGYCVKSSYVVVSGAMHEKVDASGVKEYEEFLNNITFNSY